MRKFSVFRPLATTLGLALFLPAAFPQPQAPALLAPDPRYKADLLLVIAHPDDDVLVGAWLAHLTLDEHKRVAVVYCTRGDGGGNSVGNEAGLALGQMREIEARRALASFSIENVWFLNGHDTPGQNVLRSLDSWNHGLALDEMVRLVRLTRPDVILTWLPHPVVGENHDDHQAAGVLAVEAFDTAADPTQFPEQVSPPRDRTGMANLTEGLLPWQPKKLYFFTDAFENFNPYWSDPGELPPFRKTIIDGTGPGFDPKAISPARHKSYAQLNAEQQTFYQTQEGAVGDKAIQSGNFTGFEFPVHFIFGKSLVGGSITGDVFEGIQSTPIAFARARGYQPAETSGLSIEIGDPWRFYALFWKAHNLDTLAALMPAPEMSTELGDRLIADLLACNHTAQPAEIDIASKLPEGWSDQTPRRFPVQPGECYPIQAHLAVALTSKTGWQQLTWTANANAQAIGSVTVNVFVGKSGGLPQ
jgi:LmbE family N-acetylglucosaminyl deacetylase